MKTVNWSSSVLLLFVLFIFTSVGCEKNACKEKAIILYSPANKGCELLFYIGKEYYEPTNIEDYQGLITYNDTQSVTLDYYRINDFSNCGAIDKIEILCLNP